MTKKMFALGALVVVAAGIVVGVRSTIGAEAGQKMTLDALSRVENDMTQEEVRKLAGDPRGSEKDGKDVEIWRYEGAHVEFNKGKVAEVGFD